MSMNKKFWFFVICLLMFPCFVFAEDCGSWHTAGKTICEQKSYNGKKCVYKTQDVCYLTNNPSNGNDDNQNCSAWSSKGQAECVKHSYSGKMCGWMSNVSLCMEETLSNTSTSSGSNNSSNFSGIDKKCSELSTDDCKKSQECELVGGTCTDSQVAEAPCDDNNIRKVLKIFGAVLTVAKFFVPLLIIGFGSFDLYKSVIDKDEKSLSKQLRMIIMRVIAGMVVFFLPDLIYFVFNSLDNNINNNGYKTCAECVLKPSANDLCTISE